MKLSKASAHGKDTYPMSEKARKVNFPEEKPAQKAARDEAAKERAQPDGVAYRAKTSGQLNTKFPSAAQLSN